MNRPEYARTAVADAVERAHAALAEAITAADAEHQWTRETYGWGSPADQYAAEEVTRLRRIYNDLAIMRTSPLGIRPTDPGARS